jgi:hypothetical protein
MARVFAHGSIMHDHCHECLARGTEEIGETVVGTCQDRLAAGGHQHREGRGTLPQWFRRFGDIPGVVYATPAGIDGSSLADCDSIPEVQTYRFDGKGRADLVPAGTVLAGLTDAFAGLVARAQLEPPTAAAAVRAARGQLARGPHAGRAGAPARGAGCPGRTGQAVRRCRRAPAPPAGGQNSPQQECCAGRVGR